jgi:hypothetical protein
MELIVHCFNTLIKIYNEIIDVNIHSFENVNVNWLFQYGFDNVRLENDCQKHVNIIYETIFDMLKNSSIYPS